jgi:glucosamine kinase
MAYYLGIDGGGTKTRCFLGDETTVLADAMTGGSNIVRLGEMQAREALQSVILQACGSAKISPQQIRAVCIGAAGAARPEIAAKILGMVGELIPEGPATTIEILGDTEIALAAAFGNGAGVIAIAGTGSIAYGRNSEGHTARAGGWGFAVSDEGSGHWIGRKAVSAVLSARDQGRETALTGLVLDASKLRTVDDLVPWANAAPQPDFPRLFPVVLQAAGEADSVARTILTEAGERLAALAAVVLGRLSVVEQNAIGAQAMRPAAESPVAGLPIAITGSVFRQSQWVRQVFYNTLQTSFPGIDVRQDPIDPVEGALARARRHRP